MGKFNTAGEGGFLALLALIATFAVPRYVDGAPLAWVITCGALILFCGGIGWAINGRPAGVVIDIRNRVSLSKFQAAAWTVLVLSALIVAVMLRIRSGDDAVVANRVSIMDAIKVGIPQNLLIAMGISATSLVATPVILSQKRNLTPSDGAEAATAAKLGDDPTTVTSDGKVYGRNDPGLAEWMDMFRGDEVETAGSPDLSKVQQFLVTLVVLMVYGNELMAMFADQTAKQLTQLPDFTKEMAWLVGISHGGYLAYKAAPHGGSGDPVDPTPDAAVG